MPTFLEHLQSQLQQIRDEGLFKSERVIESPQSGRVALADDATAINLCANNYLGLANHPELIQATKDGLDRWGYGTASVRFICGTQGIHRTLEKQLSSFLSTDDTILYSSCFDANGGLFETLLSEEDAVISDQLNHASIIDGIRLCKARRFRYRNNDMDDLRKQLEESRDARFRMIATDGVFSMDGYLANLPDICQLADEFDALVMVDDSHAVGFMGDSGAGTPERFGVQDRVDILTGTLGKAMGGASGGYTSGHQAIIDYLRQRSRPYLFSNSLAPPIAAASVRALDLIRKGDELRQRLFGHTERFRQRMLKAGFRLLPGEHPIVPVMIGDAAAATQFADALLAEGVYVIGFSFPVVPRGEARIRTQMSAGLTDEQLDSAADIFESVGRRLDIIK